MMLCRRKLTTTNERRKRREKKPSFPVEGEKKGGKTR